MRSDCHRILRCTGAGCPSSTFLVHAQASSGLIHTLKFDTGSGTVAIAVNSCSNCPLSSFTSPLWAYGPYTLQHGTQAFSEFADGTSFWGNVYNDFIAIVDPDSGAAITAPVALNIVPIQSQSTDGFRAHDGTSPTARTLFPPDPCFDDSIAQRGKVPFVGFLGFGPAALAVPNTDSFSAALFAQQPNISSQFGLALCEHSGSLWLGGVNSSAYLGELQWSNMSGMAAPLTRTINCGPRRCTSTAIRCPSLPLCGRL